MYPMGSNGAGQAILDARALATALGQNSDPAAALAAYEKQRLEATTRIVLTNRTNPPDAILREVFERTGDRPFKAIEDVISRKELVGCSSRSLASAKRSLSNSMSEGRASSSWTDLT